MSRIFKRLCCLFFASFLPQLGHGANLIYSEVEPVPISATLSSNNFSHYAKFSDLDIPELEDLAIHDDLAKFALALRYRQTGENQNLQKYWIILNECAAAGNTDALNELGMEYWTGRQVNQDVPRARQLFQEAAEQNNALATYNLAILELESSPSLDAAISNMQRASELGLDAADYWLGSIYLYGEVVPANLDLAYKYLHTSAKTFEPAKTRLGEYFLLASDAADERRVQKGLALLDAKSKAGDPEASIVLGRYYMGEYGAEHDFEKARNYFCLARSQGGDGALLFLIKIELEIGADTNEFEPALALAASATKSEEPGVWLLLGDEYRKGEILQRNLDKALDFYQKAANAGETTGMYNLAVFYLKHRDAESWAIARYWLELAASSGHTKSRELMKDKGWLEE